MQKCLLITSYVISMENKDIVMKCYRDRARSGETYRSQAMCVRDL